MNIITFIMLIFFLLGFLDNITGNHFHLGKGMEKGLGQLGNMGLSVIGFYVMSVAIIEKNVDAVDRITSTLPFDPSVLSSMVLDVTMGGYSVANEIAATPEMVLFSGILVASSIGCLVAFQIPIVFTCVEKEHMGLMIRGLIIGIITVPVGVFVGGFLYGVPVLALIFNMIPIFLLCIILVFGITRAPELTRKILAVIGNVLKAVAHGLTILVFLSLFFPQLRNIVPFDLALDSLNMTVKMTISMAGGMVLCEGALYYGEKQIKWIADIVGVNNYSVMGFIMSLVSPLAMFPIFHKMDDRGKLMNSAFTVFGAYIIGAQMSFVGQVTTGKNLYIYMLSKLISGVLAMMIAARMQEKTVVKEKDMIQEKIVEQ